MHVIFFLYIIIISYPGEDSTTEATIALRNPLIRIDLHKTSFTVFSWKSSNTEGLLSKIKNLKNFPNMFKAPSYPFIYVY